MILRKAVALIIITTAPVFALAQKKNVVKPVATKAPAQMKTQTDSASYALGVLIGRNLIAQGIDSLNTEILAEALKAVLEEKSTQLNDQQCQTVANGYAMELKTKQGEKNLKKGEAFLAKNKLRPGVITTASGLQYEMLQQGPDGPKPGPTSKCKVHYHGTLLDGRVFDSSVQRGQPLPCSPNGVIKAWTEALQMMTVGTKLKIYCPTNIAYGLNGSPPKIGPNEVLVFEMELISIDQP